MGKYQFYSTLFAFIAAVCFGFAVELIVRLRGMYINQTESIAQFLSNLWEWESLVIFVCAGIFFLIISYLLNREAWKIEDEREKRAEKQAKKMAGTFTDIKNLLRQIKEGMDKRNER